MDGGARTLHVRVYVKTPYHNRHGASMLIQRIVATAWRFDNDGAHT